VINEDLVRQTKIMISDILYRELFKIINLTVFYNSFVKLE